MKNDKSRRKNHDEYEDEDMEYRTSHKKSGPRRRPIRNWKKAWTKHEKDFQDHDDFYGK